jgi:hypothetical protein
VSEAVVKLTGESFNALVALDPPPADSVRTAKLQRDPSSRLWLEAFAREVARGRANRERLTALLDALQGP